MNERDTFVRGFVVVMLFHLIMLPLGLLTVGITILFIGLAQLAYVIPMARKAYKLGETARMQGILAAAGVTVLVNCMCDAKMLPNL